MRKRLLGSLVACLALLCLFFWHYSRPTVLRVGFWTGSYWGVPTSDSYAVLDAAIEKFQAVHPDVRVEYVSGLLQRDYSEWLMAGMLTGDAPDVFIILPEDFEAIAAMGGLEDLSDDAAAWQENFYPATLSAGKWEGCQYALPYECVPRLMFVNVTLLEKEGIPLPDNAWTWRDFYAICQKVTKDTNGDGMPDQFGCCNYTWEDAMYANGGYIFADDGRSCDLTSKEIVEAIAFVGRLNALSGDHVVTAKEFESGQVAFRPMLFSEYRAYQSYPWRIKKYSSFAWDCLKMPAGNSGSQTSELVTLQAGVSSQSDHKGLAREFLLTLTCDEEIQHRIYTDSRGCSPLIGVTASRQTASILREHTLSKGSMDLSMLDGILQDAYTVPQFRNYSQVMGLVRTKIDKAMSEPDKLALNLASAQVEINRVLKQ